MGYVRKIVALTVALIFCLIYFVGCNDDKVNNEQLSLSGFSAHILDVGEGDAIFLHFPDGKNMLIDCGDKKDGLGEYIIKFIKNLGVKTLDYMMITHPDSDHAGNGEKIINAFTVGKLFIPHIVEKSLIFYPVYESFYNLVLELEIQTDVSDCYDVIIGDDYKVAFLSPYPKNFPTSSYVDFNDSIVPSSEESNALSPIIYVEVYGVRFVFTGDATVKQEAVAMLNLKTNKAHYEYYDIDVNLSSVDFLKVAHHGGDDSSSEDFLSLLKPKNAIISVGANNVYGHPTRAVLERLQKANAQYNLYRTDVYGTVSIGVNADGEIKILTEKNN